MASSTSENDRPKSGFPLKGGVQLLRALTPSQHAACCAVEDSAFTTEAHRATHEKLAYRISTPSAPSFGFFVPLQQGDSRYEFLTANIEKSRLDTLTTNVRRDDEDDGPVPYVLIAHLVSTMGTAPVVEDKDMAFPQNWRDMGADDTSELGHQKGGRTVCLHSLAVIPEVQGAGVGTAAVREYMREMSDGEVGDRVALLCQPELIGFYKKLGFEEKGESKAEFAGGNWTNMVAGIPKAENAPEVTQ
ncbi:uncharacterized protein DNG_08631 [Cephalotrichum gorgonifer]|uniref:N-acetyltransferase domain-containing protein n=1 Tax=Cephalotrichum gorgonifer TaxID=2041049 RepID=A0AAE8SZC6_9PEZI|nr:uncharacterized protein DNG_08631 [Cephalotrichum gorgonifer]